jgi:Icc protein
MSVDPNMVRRGFLKCMTGAGSAMVWTVAGGVPRSRMIGSAEAVTDEFTFVTNSPLYRLAIAI